MRNLEYDAESDSLYARITSKRTSLTVEISPRIGVDVSSDGRVTGVEILDASKVISDLFHKKISKNDIEKMLCKITEEDAVYLNFELNDDRASLAVPKAYQSPVLSLVS